MDRTGIIVVSLCVVLLGIWFVEQNKLQTERMRYAATNQTVRVMATNPADFQTSWNAAASAIERSRLPVFDTNHAGNPAGH